MSFIKSLLHTKTHPSALEPPFTLQKLLYKRYQDRPPTSQHLSPLIKTLLNTIERSFCALYEFNTESSSVREALKDYVLLMTRYEAQHLTSDLAKLEERDIKQDESYDKLYTEVFVTLAETVFLVCAIVRLFLKEAMLTIATTDKMIKSVHDGGPNRDDPDINQPRITYAMDLIRDHALSFGFEPDGQNLYNISKGNEEYTFLYMPNVEVNKAVEKALCTQVREWMRCLQQLVEGIAKLAWRGNESYARYGIEQRLRK